MGCISKPRLTFLRYALNCRLTRYQCCIQKLMISEKMIDLKILKTCIAFFISIHLKSSLLVDSLQVLSQDIYTTNDYYFDISDIQVLNDSENKIRILYSTHYDILETNINENFTQLIETKEVKSQLTDPTELYYSLNGNFLFYEMIGFFYICPMDANKVNSLGLTAEHPLPNSVKANSQLNIDWIHDLFYWVKDKKQILVANIRQVNKIVVLANKLYDYITCLALNPIDSFAVWIEFDSEYNEYIVFKSYADGSNRHPFLSFKTHIKRLEFDFQSKRIYYLSNFELSSTTYEGADRRTVVKDSHSIFQFEVLSNHIYWIEYHSNQLFRADLSDYKNSQKVITFNHTINRFQLIDYWRQPIGINKCLNTSCSDICLPVDSEYFRCVCHQQKTCSDNQDIQLVFNEHRLVREAQTTSTTTTTTHMPMTTTHIKYNTTVDKISLNPIEKIDSLSFNDRDTTHGTDDDLFVNLNDFDYHNIFKSVNSVSSLQTTNQFPNTTPNDLNVTKDDKKVETKTEVKTELDKSLKDLGNDKQIESENRDKHIIESTTNKDLKYPTLLTNKTSNEILFEEKKNVSDIDSHDIRIDEMKEKHEYNFIPKSLYTPMIYGLILLICGLFIGTILSAIAIRIHGKHNCRSTYSTNSGTTNKWDSVGFQKADQNIYFGAKYTVKDESLY